MKGLIYLFVISVVAVFMLAAAVSAGGIYLKSGTIDTDVAAGPAAVSGPKLGAGYYLLQLVGPVSESDKQVLASAGAEIVEYVPDNAFVIHIEHSAAGQLKKLPIVKWMAPFKAEYKMAPGLLSNQKASQFLVTLFPGQDPQYVLDRSKRLGARKMGAQKSSRGSVCRILANKSQVSALAQSSAVAWIEPYVQPKLCNDVASGISGVPDVRQNLGLYGAGQLVGVADSGLDTGSTSTISADFANKIQKTYALRRPGDWSDLTGHGTHVTGSVLGSGVLSGSNPATHAYTGSFAGYAPEARLIFQSIGDSGAYVFPPLHLLDLFQPVYTDGVRVHSDSWGSAVSGEYTVYSNEVDQFVWDHKDFSVVFAVGNEGRDTNGDGRIEQGNIYAPATAKNCISVGATENVRTSGGYQTGYGYAWPSDYPTAPIKMDLISNAINGMAAFSGRGPTADGRIKPDICAPGTNIISCRSHVPGSDTGWAAYNSNYIYWGGTSMSTPQVAGAAALVREYYQKHKSINPSAALVKATMINGAVDMSPGQYGTTSHRELYAVPDNSQGWGRLNLKQSLYPDPPVMNEIADESAGISTGEYRDYQYNVVDNSVPLKVTLVWTDYPGSVHAAKELVNNIDLTVIAPNGTLYPDLGICNDTDNVEQIIIPSPQIGAYHVRVIGTDVPMGAQDYALVVSGGLPNTYIAGTVTSSSGAPVQGAIITFVSTAGNKRVTTNSSGRYASHVSPGSYSVQVSKPGWTFTPRAQMVQVQNTPMDNINFQGSGAPGNVSGKLTSTIGGVVSKIVESPHPYLNSSDQTYTITAHEGATRMRVHFAEIDLMNDGDTIYILDGNDNRVDTFTWKGEDIWSSWVTGSVIKIELVTNDYGNIGYGFYVDGYETDLIGQGGLGGATVTLTPGGYTATSTADGTYNLQSVPPGTYTVTPTMPHWKFQPADKIVDIPSGGTAAGVDFQAFPPGTITGEVLVASSKTTTTNIESEHPYLPNSGEYELWEVDGGASATRIRLHFSTLITEPAWDWVLVLDGNDNIIESYTGGYDNLWTPWINGRIAKINLTSDSDNNEFGFICDRYEIESAGGGLVGARITLSPDGRTATTANDGTFSLNSVDVGDHTVSPLADPWVFDPVSTSVNVAAGIEQHLLFYAKVADVTSVVFAKMLADGYSITLKDMTVSAVFNGSFYVEDANRSGGLCVVSSAAVSLGSKVSVTGTLETINGERRIRATSVNQY